MILILIIIIIIIILIIIIIIIFIIKKIIIIIIIIMNINKVINYFFIKYFLFNTKGAINLLTTNYNVLTY